MLWSLLLAGQENSENIEMGLFGTWFLTVWCGAFGGRGMPRFLKALKEQFMSRRWTSYRLFLGGQMHPVFPFLLPWLICLIVVAFVLFSFYLFSHFPPYTSYVLWFLFCTVLFFYQQSFIYLSKKKKRLEVIAQTNVHKESHLKVTSVVLYNQKKNIWKCSQRQPQNTIMS